jgi:hypothetical protein
VLGFGAEWQAFWRTLPARLKDAFGVTNIIPPPPSRVLFEVKTETRQDCLFESDTAGEEGLRKPEIIFSLLQRILDLMCVKLSDDIQSVSVTFCINIWLLRMWRYSGGIASLSLLSSSWTNRKCLRESGINPVSGKKCT